MNGDLQVRTLAGVLVVAHTIGMKHRGHTTALDVHINGRLREIGLRKDVLNAGPPHGVLRRRTSRRSMF